MEEDSERGRSNYFAILGEEPKTKRKAYNVSNHYDFPALKIIKPASTQQNLSCPKFLLIKSKTEKSIKTYNIFAVSKALESITTEKPLEISFTKEGDLLILVKTQQQANKYLKATQLSNICNISVTLHPTLNISKGVIYSGVLKDLSEDEIVEGLKQQGAVECKKIKKYIEGKLTKTPLHIVSFSTYTPPKEVNVGWLKIKVEPYIPSPMQCKNCFMIGHTAKHCTSEAKCNVCSSSIHSSTPCSKVLCINCKHNHRSNNKECPTYRKRQDIIKHKTLNKCSFKEAIESVNKYNTDYSKNVPEESVEEAIQKRIKEPQTTTNGNNNYTKHNSTTTIRSQSASCESNNKENNFQLSTNSALTSTQLHLDPASCSSKAIINQKNHENNLHPSTYSIRNSNNNAIENPTIVHTPNTMEIETIHMSTNEEHNNNHDSFLNSSNETIGTETLNHISDTLGTGTSQFQVHHHQPQLPNYTFNASITTPAFEQYLQAKAAHNNKTNYSSHHNYSLHIHTNNLFISTYLINSLSLYISYI